LQLSLNANSQLQCFPFCRVQHYQFPIISEATNIDECNTTKNYSNLNDFGRIVDHEPKSSVAQIMNRFIFV
jgi:hypothetical protein